MFALDGYTVRKCVREAPESALYTAVRDADGLEVLLKRGRADGSGLPQRRAEHEFRMLRRLAGPGVAEVLELQRSGNDPVLVLRSIEGLPLPVLLAARTLDPSEFLQVAAGLAQTLARVHAEHLIHRDVSPQSVFVDPSTLQTTLVELASAQPLGAAAAELRSPSGSAADAFAYMAPEQTGRMDRGIDFRSDLYSLGATLYEVLTGGPPFAGEGALELIHAHMARLPVSPQQRRPGIPSALSRIVLKLLQKQPEDRYQTAHALHTDLVECRAELERSGRIADDHALGGADAPDRPLFSKRLYGRERERDALCEAYDRASRGASEFVLLRGAAGIGKSALVHELRPLLARSDGYLVSGKFDLYRRDLPYAALQNALNSLVHQLLTESAERLADWRERIRDGLGALLGVMVEWVPDLRLVAGDGPPPPALGPQETHARLCIAVERFLNACGTPEHPLVFFLDDLQWADPGSRSLLEHLLAQRAGRSLLVIAAYRDHEVDAGHPFSSVLERLVQRGVRPTAIDLIALDAASCAQMLASALGRTVEETRVLADCVVRKTGSNPLLIQQFILHVHALGMIRFAPPNRWVWDDAAIAAANIPDGAVALMMAKLQRLDEAPRELIQFASCIGDRFDSEALAELKGESLAALEPALFTLAQEGLITPSSSGFRFVHDRIREAAQELLSSAARAVLHHRIGMLLWRATAPEQLFERCFEIADHLNRGLAHASDEERELAKRVNIMAGERALKAGAAASASNYLAYARALFRPEEWQSDPRGSFSLFWTAAEAEYQTNGLDLALRLLDVLDEQRLDRLQQAQVIAKRIAIATLVSQEEAADMTFAALRRFGVRWPRRPSWLRIRWEILRTDWMLRGPLDERLFRRAPDLAQDALPAALLFSAGAVALVHQCIHFICLGTTFSLRVQRRYGTPLGPLGPTFTLAAYAASRAGTLFDATQVRRCVDAAREWMERMPHPIRNVRAEFELLAMTLPWIRPRSASFAPLRAAYDAAREIGEIQYAYYCLLNRASYWALCGGSIPELLGEFDALYERDPLQSELYASAVYRSTYELLRRSRAGADDLETALARIEEKMLARPPAAPYYWVHALAVLCFLRRFDLAWELAERVADVVFGKGAPRPTLVDFAFFHGLCALAVDSRVCTTPLRRRRRLARAYQRRIARAARHGPDFVHMAGLLDAECAAVRGDLARALRLYGQAARRAREQGFRNHAALIHERRADLFAARGRRSESLLALGEAAQLYGEWGATVKVEEIARRQAELRQPGRS